MLVLYRLVLWVGLPVAIFHGMTSGDWTWLLAWAVVAVVGWIADKLGLVHPTND